MWRISAHRELVGLGGERTDGRWHTARPGKRIVYLAEHPALALVETLVNLRSNPQFFPASFQLLRVMVADDVSEERIDPEILPPKWREDQSETQDLGDGWLARAASALLAVPSAPSPESTNYLLNPLHPDATRVTVAWSRRIQYDRRLFGIRTVD